MKSAVSWLSWLLVAGSMFVAGSMLVSCADSGSQEPEYVAKFSVTEGQVTDLGNGWSMGLEWVSFQRFTDDEGRKRIGWLARVSIAQEDGGAQAESIVLYEGKVFTMGDRQYLAIRLRPNTSFKLKPGTSNGYIVIGQLP